MSYSEPSDGLESQKDLWKGLQVKQEPRKEGIGEAGKMGQGEEDQKRIPENGKQRILKKEPKWKRMDREKMCTQSGQELQREESRGPHVYLRKLAKPSFLWEGQSCKMETHLYVLSLIHFPYTIWFLWKRRTVVLFLSYMNCSMKLLFLK